MLVIGIVLIAGCGTKRSEDFKDCGKCFIDAKVEVEPCMSCFEDRFSRCEKTKVEFNFINNITHIFEILGLQEKTCLIKHHIRHNGFSKIFSCEIPKSDLTNCKVRTDLDFGSVMYFGKGCIQSGAYCTED